MEYLPFHPVVRYLRWTRRATLRVRTVCGPSSTPKRADDRRRATHLPHEAAMQQHTVMSFVRSTRGVTTLAVIALAMSACALNKKGQGAIVGAFGNTRWTADCAYSE